MPRRFLTILTLVAAACAAGAVRAQVILDENPAEAAGVRLDEQRGAQIPAGLTFTGADGSAVAFDGLFDGERPVVLVMGYYDCPLLCPWVFNSMQLAFNELAWKAGKEYRVVTVSIDPTNTGEQAAEQQRKAIDGLRRGATPDGWRFLLSPDDQVKRLAEAVGFGYVYLEDSGEYSHPGVAIVLSPTGSVSQYLQVNPLPEKQLRLSLMDAADGKIGSFIDKFIFSCHVYDPDAGSFVLHAKTIMNIAGALTAAVLAAVVGGLLLNERLRRRAAAHQNASSPEPRGVPAAAK